MRQFLALPIALSLLGLVSPPVAVASSVNPVRPAVVAAETESKKIYTIVAEKIESVPPGCYGCMPEKRSVPTFSPVVKKLASNYIDLFGATEIDTFSQTTWDHSSCQQGACNPVQETVEGACALVGGKLLCFGANQFGQAGNEPPDPTTLITPTLASEGGVVLTNVSDVAANGETTCIVQSGALKCVGKGNWPDLKFRQGYTSYHLETHTWDADEEFHSSSTSTSSNDSYLSETLDSEGNILSSMIGNGYSGDDSRLSKTWRTLLTDGVKSIQIGAANGSTPSICALMINGTVQCANVTASNEGERNYYNEQRYDCSDPLDGEYESEEWCTSVWSRSTPQIPSRTFKSRVTHTNVSAIPASTWAWTTAKTTPDENEVATDITNATDISMTAASWGSGQLCIAAAAVTCRSFSGAKFGVTGAAIEGSEGATRVYMTSNNGQAGLCIHNQGTLSCGTSQWNGSSNVMPAKLTPVGVMEEPLSIFTEQIGQMNKIYFVLPSGLLSAEAWIFSCDQCYSSSSNVLEPVSAFADSTAYDYNYMTGITGAIDSVKFIPIKVIAGVRTTRSGALLKFETDTGEVLAGASFKWATPDFPVLASSSKSTNLTTDKAGTVRLTVASGPVTFTIKGGILSSGTSLQSSTVTAMIPIRGNATIKVSTSSALVTRTVKVVMADGNPVPNATIKLKNNYLSYAYVSSASGTSSWAAEVAGDDFGSTNCSHCFVPPPVYITGDDGIVSFKSFVPRARSSKFDALIEYDDGEINKSIEVNFQGLSDTVVMPFMPGIDVAIRDSDPSTITVDVNTNSKGEVTIPFTLIDENGDPYSRYAAAATEVCEAADLGGLFGATDSITSICGDTKSANSAASESRVGFAAKCKGGTKTNKKGKGIIKICATSSKKYRIAGIGALPSQTFCVRVKGVKCSEPVSASQLKIFNIAGAETAKFSKGILKSIGTNGKQISSYGMTKVLPKRRSIHLEEMANIAEGKNGVLRNFNEQRCTITGGCFGLTKTLTPKICKVQGSYVTALKKRGICQIQTELTDWPNFAVSSQTLAVYIQVR